MNSIILSRMTDGSPSVLLLFDEGSAPLKHYNRHSPDGFEWGYGGSGPADLAFSVLVHFYNEEIAEKYYHDFKRDIIASVPKSVKRFEIEIDLVKNWLDRTIKRKAEDKKPKNIFNPLLKSVPTFSYCPICNKEFIDNEDTNGPIKKCSNCGASFKR